MEGKQERAGNSPRSVLRVLIAEDTPADAELMVAMLKRAGYAVAFDVVDSPNDFQNRISRADYDLVLSDHNLKTWTGEEALKLLSRSGKDIAFIVVTGTLGDEAAVDYIKHGAADYVLKHRLDRLPVAVGRALQEKARRHETKRLQEAIASGKREWELTFDAIRDPVFVLDGEGKVLRANRAAAETVRREFSQLIGETCYEVLHGLSSPPSSCPHARMMQSGVEESGEVEEARLDRVFDATACPLRDASGVLTGCVHVIRDITARKRADEALRESEERYRFLFQNSPQPMWIYDADSLSFLGVNDTALEHYGYSREEFLSMKITDIRPPEDVPALLKEISKEMPQIDFAGIWRHRKKDGSVIFVEVTSHRLPFGTGSTRLVLARDVTEQKRLEEQLRQAQKMEAIGRLAGGIAHDFNNLLTIINGYSQLLLDGLNRSDRLSGHAEEIKNAGERAALLTRQLLAFSRRQVLQPQVLDLNQVISGMEKMLARLIGEDIELRTVPASHLGRVKADAGQIEQVIMNLAVNSRDAMPKGGRLTIETANVELDESYARSHVAVTPGPHVMLAVSDTGCGMEAETRARIFEPFFTTKEKGKGTGLGLATVYGIVKQSGGSIWVYSEPGQGTTFKIYLPRVMEAVAAPEPAKAGTSLIRGTETVLLVEDEPSLRAMVRGILEGNGYAVLEARHGKDAIAVANQHKGPIHLLLTDVVMPELNGPDLADHLLSLRREMRVLFMSGYTDNAVVHHGVLHPGKAFLQKPFTPEILARKVREVLDGA